MPLERGTRFGPYEVVAPLGTGGMGEVCRARDTKLQRDVALKVLSDAFVADASRAARFQREAQLLATLNHPHIAAIYGIEDAGPRSAIVMELVEGQTLAEMLERGPLPLAEAMLLAKQIADALEYAHEKGIIHRDLKPANVKVTPDGSIKVLDFGLAKALDDGSDSSVELPNSLSPTLSLMASQAGVVLGTASYMAPEQAKGKAVDRRADVWAFGVVLYEMLTGRRMFGGDSIAETLAGVIKEPIPLGTLPADVPPAIRRLLDRCLERDVRRRLQSIGEARILLEDAIDGSASAGAAGVPPMTGASSGGAIPWTVAAVTSLAAIAAAGWIWARPAPNPPPAVRFTVAPPPGMTLTATGPNASQMAVSPDGRSIAIVVDEPGLERSIWIRDLDSLTARRLDRTEGAMFPFWSSDSKHLAYFTDGKLLRVSADGGAPLTLADAPGGEGGTWFQDSGGGVIVYAPDAGGPLYRVSAQGGPSTPVTTLGPGERSHSFPQFLPDGRRFLYLMESSASAIRVQSLDPGPPATLLETTGRAVFAPPGWLLFMRENSLLAQRLNVETLTLEGEAMSVADDVRTGAGNGRNSFSLSSTGVLTYRASLLSEASQVRWYSRAGKVLDAVLDPGDYQDIDLSPDDSHVVVVRGASDVRTDLWIKELRTGVLSRLTNDDGREAEPVWSHDAARIAYIHVKDGVRTLFETRLGSGKQTPIPVEATGSLWLDDWTSDSRELVAHGGERGTVHVLEAPDGTSTPGTVRPRRVFDERYPIDQVRVSPDRKWAAYTSTESGRPEVNVAAYPSFTDRRQVSAAGGVQPVWRADGRELFFVSAGAMMAVDVRSTPALELGPVRTLFPTSIVPSRGNVYYDVTRDGQRFLVRELAGARGVTTESLHVIVNWTSLLPQ